jgi:hypothetical protein
MFLFSYAFEGLSFAIVLEGTSCKDISTLRTFNPHPMHTMQLIVQLQNQSFKSLCGRERCDIIFVLAI